jgi:SAM-dependent methyltransferase
LAAGIGCEAGALAELGFEVTANEVNLALRSCGQRRLRNGKCVTWTTSDWRTIAHDLQPSRFDALLLLGNSFCLMENDHDRQRSLEEFAALCAHNGTLIIDVRNFAYILGARDAILRGDFRYGRRVMYCGKQVTGRPTAISESLVTFGYFDETGRQRGALDMVPLLVEELADACTRAGFRSIEVFSDFKHGLDAKADFFTCVCRL